MRIRHKPWAGPELDACPFFIDTAKQSGGWSETFEKRQPLWLELGCGKGGFAAETALQNPEINMLAVDIKNEVLVLGKRTAERCYAAAGRSVGNLRFTAFDIERISQLFLWPEPVERLYIHFPNPWPKPRHHKHRLTHTRQLLQYRPLLQAGGRLLFKTDDAALFFETCKIYLPEAGYRILTATDNLYRDGVSAAALLTEHERMFIARTLPIYALEAEPVVMSDEVIP